MPIDLCRAAGSDQTLPLSKGMFTDEIRQAINSSSRATLPAVSSLLWKAFAAGQITEGEAEALSALIESRRIVPTVVQAVPKRMGSRPRSPASLERRRAWTCSGRLPPAIAARFTPGEAAVLAAVAVEVRRSGDCRWSYGKLAGITGTSVSTVKRAVRFARVLGLLTVEERRVSAFRNDTNILRIVSPEWLAWLSLGTGGQSWPGRTIRDSKERDSAAQTVGRSIRRRAWTKVDTPAFNRERSTM